MCGNEGVFKVNAVVYFSSSGQCALAAKRLAKELGFALSGSMEKVTDREFESLVAVFPVYCQGVPEPVKKFLKSVEAEYFSFLALYGKMSPGNALYEAHKITGKKTVAAAYVAGNHTYNFEKAKEIALPQEVIRKILNPSYIKLPRRIKAPFAGVFPAARSRLLIKLKRNGKCVNCNICGDVCPQKAINNGIVSGRCIRCLKCVLSCPEGALDTTKRSILKKYLSKPRYDKTVIYSELSN